MTGPSQAASVAAAVLNPTYFKKSRREVLLSSSVFSSLKKSSGSLETNSFCSNFLTATFSGSS